MVDVLRQGYRLSFASRIPLSKFPIPFETYSPNSVKGRDLEEAIQSLVEKGVVEEAPAGQGSTAGSSWYPELQAGFAP